MTYKVENVWVATGTIEAVNIAAHDPAEDCLKRTMQAVKDAPKVKYVPPPKAKPLKKATKEEFNKFIDAYPNELEVDVMRICEPAQACYYDFSLAEGKLGTWEYCASACVAKIILDHGFEVDDGADGKYFGYLILDEEQK